MMTLLLLTIDINNEQTWRSYDVEGWLCARIMLMMMMMICTEGTRHIHDRIWARGCRQSNKEEQARGFPNRSTINNE